MRPFVSNMINTMSRWAKATSEIAVGHYSFKIEPVNLEDFSGCETADPRYASENRTRLDDE